MDTAVFYDKEIFIFFFIEEELCIYNFNYILCGILGFVYLVNQTFKAFNYTMTGVWFVFIAFWSLLFLQFIL